MATREQLVIDLPSDLVAGLRDAVRSGAFASESEVLETLLRSWQGDGGVEEADIETIRAFVAEGLADSEAGRVSKAEDVYARVRARIEAVAANKSR
jgi:Arc/MetJ-type ribon-helix-helix transcriptional regulator